MTAQENLDRLFNATVFAGDDRVGSVDQVFLDDDTSEPKWVTVSTGLFGTNTSFVPIDDARLDEDRLYVNVSKDAIKDAPRIDGDQHLSPDEEQQLYAYYGRSSRYDDLERRRGEAGLRDDRDRDLRDDRDRDLRDDRDRDRDGGVPMAAADDRARREHDLADRDIDRDRLDDRDDDGLLADRAQLDRDRAALERERAEFHEQRANEAEQGGRRGHLRGYRNR